MSDVWYYAERGQKVGPLPFRQLQEVLTTHSSPDDVLVWTAGFDDWKMAGDVPEFQSLILGPPPVPATPSGMRDEHRRARRMISIGKGALLGALVGLSSMVLGGVFKGNLAEPEFVAEYLGYLIPMTLVGSIIGFIVGGRRGASTDLAWGRWLFIATAAIICLVVVVKIAVEFPGGEGLFHPSRSSLAADANQSCRAKIAANNGATPAAVAAFCNCFGDKVAEAALSGAFEAPEAVAKRAAAACQ